MGLKPKQEKAMDLIEAGIKSDLIADVFGIPENELAEGLEDRQLMYRDTEAWYKEHERPKVEKNVQELLSEIPHDEKRKVRVQLLIERMKDAKKNHDITELRRYVNEYRILMGLAEDISPEDIIQAREYPITNLIKTRQGMASCPFHKDTNPSLNIRKNFYYCHSCGETGDTISLAMKLEGLTFRQAVDKLK